MLQLLHLPTRQSGVGLPYMRMYYKVAYLNRLIGCHCHAKAKHWVAMEMEDLRKTVKNWPWITLSFIPLLVAPLSSSAFPLPSPVNSILGNPEFEPGLQSPQFQHLVSSKLSSNAVATTSEPPLDFRSNFQL